MNAEVEVVGDADALEALEAEWWALWSSELTATPFQSPAWLLPWWRHFGHQPGWSLHTLALRHAGRLVGLAPLFLHPGPEGERQLSPLGIGITDYHDVLLAPEAATDGAALLLRALSEQSAAWDVADLEELPPGSALLAAAVPEGLAASTNPQSICPIVPLPASADAYLAARSAWLRRNLRRGVRRLGASGALRFESATTDTLPEFIAAFFRLHEERWQDTGEPGVFVGAAVQAFHREAATALLGRGLLRLHGLRLGEQLIALWYGLAAGGRIYAYQSGFLPAHARDNPGTLIVGHAIEQAIAEGAREFDFLRGAEPYKYDWGAEDRRTVWMRLRGRGKT